MNKMRNLLGLALAAGAALSLTIPASQAGQNQQHCQYHRRNDARAPQHIAQKVRGGQSPLTPALIRRWPPTAARATTKPPPGMSPPPTMWVRSPMRVVQGQGTGPDAVIILHGGDQLLQDHIQILLGRLHRQMKKICLCLLLTAALTMSTSALKVPTSTVVRNLSSRYRSRVKCL